MSINPIVVTVQSSSGQNLREQKSQGYVNFPLDVLNFYFLQESNEI